MQPDRALIQKYFSKLGLDADIADMYLSLHEFGPQSISELSRNSGVERTRVYRLIDGLLESNLVEVDANYKRGILKAAPIANLNILINRKAQELEGLQDELELIQQVLGRNSLSSPATRVQMYYGSQGVQQMLWNITRSKSDVLAILHEDIGVNPAGRFFGRWVQKCNEDTIQLRILSNTAPGGVERLAHTKLQTITPSAFPISHSTIAYDDVTAHINWQDGEVFGIETYNKEIAETQQQLFELLWQKTTR